jgi:hypothetical protein
MTVSSARRTVGILRLIAGATLVVALVFQITEKAVNNDLIADQYFSYFTILATILAIVVLIVGGVLALRHPVDPVAYTVARMSVTTYAVVTALVYNVLLRGIPDEGFIVSPWPGEIMHVWIPLFLLLDWLFSPGRPALRWTGLRIVVIFPLVWIAFTLVRGAITGWFPYPFLEPSTGILSIALYILGIAALIIGLASLAIAWSRRGYLSRASLA